EFVAGALAQPVGDAVESEARVRVAAAESGARDEELLERRSRLIGELAEVLVGCGDDSPSEDGEALLCGDPLDAGLLLAAGARLQREEREACGVLAGGGKLEVC